MLNFSQKNQLEAILILKNYFYYFIMRCFLYKNDIEEIKEKISAIQKFINDTHTKLLKVRRGAY